MHPDDLEGLFRGIAPPKVAFRAAPCDGDDANCREEERRAVAEAGESRRKEFLAGRSCARLALEELGVAAGPILRGERGLPAWPTGYLGSISHCKGLCLAVAARRADYVALGVDLERTDRLGAAAANRVVHPEESRWAGSERERAGILFSLKEAFYKAQFPRFGIHANFGDLAFAVDEGRGEARIVEFADRLGELRTEGAGVWRFRFRTAGNFVVSVGSAEA